MLFDIMSALEFSVPRAGVYAVLSTCICGICPAGHIMALANALVYKGQLQSGDSVVEGAQLQLPRPAALQQVGSHNAWIQDLLCTLELVCGLHQQCAWCSCKVLAVHVW